MSTLTLSSKNIANRKDMTELIALKAVQVLRDKNKQE